MSSRPPASKPTSKPLAWTDLVLVAMGVVLVCGFAVGVVSEVPLRVSGGIGSVLATAMWLGSVAVNPGERTA
jgi:hypothetical protein